jgi:anti-sigma factor RsiW
MRCDKVRDQLVAYLDGELSAEEREIVDTHLANCPACRDELTVFESTDDLLAGLGAEFTPKRDLAAAVLSAAKEDPWCRHIRRELVAYVDAELDDAQARPVTEHLEDCADCRAEHDALVLSGEMLSRWEIPAFETDLVARLPMTVRFARTASRRTLIRRLVPALAAACVLVIATIGVVIGVGGLAPDEEGGNQLTVYEQKAVEHGIGPELLDPGLIELAEDLGWVEDVPELDELAMLDGSGG